MSYRNFVFMMALIMAISPFAVDAYLPAIPDMAAFLSVRPEQVATTISCYVLGIAIGQLIGGPLSDRFGRKMLILSGMVIYIIASLAITQAQTLWAIQIERVFQALGAGFSAVCIPALVRDRATGNEAAKIFALIGLIMVAAPAIAPSVGAAFLAFFEWQSIFYFLAAYAFIVTIITVKALPNDPPSKASISSLKRYAIVLSNRKAMRYAIIQAMSFSILMVTITNASLIYQEYYGVSERVFAILLGMNLVVMAILNRINSRLLSRFPATTLLRAGLLFQFCTVCVFTLLMALNAPVWIVAIGVIFTVASVGTITPNATAVYMSHFNEHTGSASALAGAAQFLIAAFTSSLSVLIYNDTLWPVVLTLLTISIVANFMNPKHQANIL